MNLPGGRAGNGREPLWRARSVWLAVIIAFVLRLGAWKLWYWEPTGLVVGYMKSVATMASGYGMLQSTPGAKPEGESRDFADPVILLMKQRQAEGGRIDPDHPYPRSLDGWIPATLHPAGYTCILYLLYVLGNYDGMITAVHFLQAGVDSLGCIFIALFARNIFSRRVGVWSAWVYALLPSIIILTCRLLPDAFGRFLFTLILCLASYSVVGRGSMMLLTGAAIGLACHFRPDYLLLPSVLFFVLWIWRRRFWSTVALSAGMVAAMLLVLSPWIMWTYKATGKAMVSTTSAGGTMYQALGQLPGNPWGITMLDEFVDEEGAKQSFSSAWSVEGDAYFRKRFRELVPQHPVYYAKLVLLHRLPLALVPPYGPLRKPGERSEFSLDKMRMEQNLSPLGVARKYPLKVLRIYWLPMAFAGLSLLMLAVLCYVAVLLRRQWRQLAWLLLPYVYTVGTMSLLKQIAPRQVSPTLIVQATALAVLLVVMVERRRRRSPSEETSGDRYANLADVVGAGNQPER
ncbi:MAG: glycosyltransferase family 39 protein [Phycisphaerae bacterium]|nr:glycosyltransferase family 39 protein [Phycisphaerae bacterium]